MPAISVVISTYNRLGMLLPAVHSALRQRGVDHEVIVVDNGSSDSTWEALQRIDDPRLRILRNESSLGPTGGRNTGLAEARGTWVGVLDDDDLWAPDKLAEQVDAAERSGRHWVYSGCVYIDQYGTLIGGEPPPTPDEVQRQLPRNYVVPGGMSNVIWRRDRLDDTGLLDERLTMTTDWDVTLRLLRNGPPAVVPRPHIGYRQHRANVSKGAAAFQHELEIVESKFPDLLAGRRVDRGAQWRFVGSEALRAGNRRSALQAYGRAVRSGDVGSLLRGLAVAAPRRLHPHLRRTFLSERAWLRDAAAWLRDLETGPGDIRSTVLFVQRSFRRYRQPFYVQLRQQLDERGIDVALTHSSGALEAGRSDDGELPWATEVAARKLGTADRAVIWQSCLPQALAADLVVTEQASRLLLNYLLVARRLVGRGPRVAFWGHGRDFDPGGATGVGEALKRSLSRRVDWWFAYTDEVAEIVSALGFPADRITVVDNATDTRALRHELEGLSAAEVSASMSELGLTGGPSAMFAGSLHAVKGLSFLWDVVRHVRRSIPDFQLVVVGDGDDRLAVERQEALQDGIVYVGPRFGRELAELAHVCDLMLVPGWAGLVVVDAFALGLPPVLSSSFPHPPERAYVQHEVNGLIVDDDGDPARYAEAVVAVLADPSSLQKLEAGCRTSAERYTVENMAQRFADGIEAALAGRRG